MLTNQGVRILFIMSEYLQNFANILDHVTIRLVLTWRHDNQFDGSQHNATLHTSMKKIIKMFFDRVLIYLAECHYLECHDATLACFHISFFCNIKSENT